MFADLPLPANAATFIASVLVVWFTGTRVARYADSLQQITRAGEALIGMLLLGFVSALPELAVTVTASYSGNAQLAVNNLLGGMALNVAILAAADAAVRRERLTAAIASSTPLLQGTLLILLLSIVAAATLTEAGVFLGIGAWSWLILAVYLPSLLMVKGTQGRETWLPQEGARSERGDHRPDTAQPQTIGALSGRIALGALAILAAGYVLTETGHALAEQTGLGSSFFGAVFLALSTSLPEITIVFSAVRMGRYAMAVGDIFGANLFCLTLLFVVDAVYGGGSVLAETGRFATFAALLGVAVTALFVAGLLERAHRMVLRMGIDSILVLATYAGGVTILHTIR